MQKPYLLSLCQGCFFRRDCAEIVFLQQTMELFACCRIEDADVLHFAEVHFV
jgi:hypothetical protein